MSVSLLCLIGLPGSGKTTLAASLKNCLSETGVEAVCVEYDLYIAEIHCVQGEWRRQRQKLLEHIRTVSGELKEVGRKSVIILDDNFYYRSMRYEVYRIAKELRLGFGQIFLNLPFDLCCLRNSSRPKPLPSEVMSRMRALIEPPDPRRNAWERHSIILSSSPLNLESILQLVATISDHPCELQTQNPPQDNSAIHYADLALRHIVNTIILSTPRDLRSQITSNLTQKKKSVLEDVKMNNIELPVVDSTSNAVATYRDVLEPYFSDLLR